MLLTMARAGIYLRISYARAGEVKDGAARKGEVLGVDKQRPPSLALCERLGWQVVEEYVDPNDSAYSGRPRKAWRRLMEDVKAGKIDAIVAWHPDRLTRQPKENEELIDLVDRYGVQVATAMAGEHDLASPSGRLHFRMLGSIARYESEHRAERVMEHHNELAAEGRWHGGRRPFGYRYVEGGGIERDEREAKAIRDARERILNASEDRLGQLSAITREWRAAGLFESKGGRPVTVTIADRLLRSPHLLGNRRHNGEVTKAGAWPAIFTPDEQATLIAELDRRGHKELVRRSRTPLGGELHCGYPDCGHVMRGATLKAAGGRQPGYRCDAASGGCGRLHRLAQPIDDEVRDRVIEALAGPKLKAKLARAAKGRLSAEEAREVKASLAADKAKLAQLDALAADLDPAAVEATRATIGARMLKNSRRLRAGVYSGPLVGLPETKPALRQAWEDWSLDRRREVIGEVVERITVRPVGRGRRADPARDVLIDWKF
jgi:DNA invertase Pin-like site-specific DNA recombinase